MGTLYENIIALCEQKGIKGGKMCTDIGMSKGILTDLKMGRQTSISTANAQKIAAYFDVTVGYLLGEEEQKETPVLPKQDERGAEIMFALSKGGQKEITDEMFDEVKRFAEYIANRQK